MTRIYPKELAEYVLKHHLIPKKVKHMEDIKVFRKYISIQQSNDAFKIEDIIEVNEQLYYQIRFLSTNRQAVVPYEPKFTYYELYQDKSKLYKVPNIINTNTPYFGSEIKYWFFINNIDLDSDKYINFKGLVTKSDFMISDRKVYYLKAEYLPLEDKYIDCKVSPYKDSYTN